MFAGCLTGPTQYQNGLLGKMEVVFNATLAHGIQLMLACIQDILENLLHPLSWGLMLSSWKVHLEMISRFHLPIHGRAVFSSGNKILKRNFSSPSARARTSSFLGS